MKKCDLSKITRGKLKLSFAKIMYWQNIASSEAPVHLLMERKNSQTKCICMKNLKQNLVKIILIWGVATMVLDASICMMKLKTIKNTGHSFTKIIKKIIKYYQFNLKNQTKMKDLMFKDFKTYKKNINQKLIQL